MHIDSSMICFGFFIASLISFFACANAAIQPPTNQSALTLSEDPLFGHNKLRILYLLQSKEVHRAIDLYREYSTALGRHDFEILQQMGLIILEQGARSADPETQLTSIFGSHIAGIAASIDILEAGIVSAHPQTQLAAIQFLSGLQDDRCEELFTKAMSSDFFFTRVEAAYHLAMRKSRTAVGQIESLMYKVPPQMRFFFAQFYALIGTHDAISLLKHMMDDPFHMNRIEAILSAARFGRDDLLPAIRSRATHLNVAQQEACATAIGYLKDSKSIPLLKKLTLSPSVNVQLAAYHSLYILGDTQTQDSICEKAKEGNLFAISLLGDMAGSNGVLFELTQKEDLQIRFNATMALLKLGDPLVYKPLLEFLICDSRDLGFYPQFSVGNSLMAWKVIPSARQHQQEMTHDLMTLSVSVREYMLQQSLEMPESVFLKVAEALFNAQQLDLIPLLVALMENLQTSDAIALLEEKAQTAGAPLTRAYCNLALLRLKKESSYKKAILNWIRLTKNLEMIRFRPMLTRHVRIAEKMHAFELTPEENSQLLVQCYQTITMQHNVDSIDILLDGLQNGHPKNRPVLAGLLIQAIQ